jgi:DNA-binding MarR family transcriptional regulator
MRELADAIVMDRSHSATNLGPMEGDELIVLKESDEDRRVMLTPAGRAIVKKATPLWPVAVAQLPCENPEVNATGYQNLIRQNPN